MRVADCPVPPAPGGRAGAILRGWPARTPNRSTVRPAVTRHALLAYLFGAIILAVMVNVIAGLVN